MYMRFPLSLRNVDDVLFERGIDLCHETLCFWRNRFNLMWAGRIRRQRVAASSVIGAGNPARFA
jgi:putative transposase